jgi:hypothetical protein
MDRTGLKRAIFSNTGSITKKDAPNLDEESTIQ